jgi:GNAT superfamily N-acetyltransferase
MMTFATTFDEAVQALPPTDSAVVDAALQQLNDEGYTIRLGLTPDYADAIATMAHEPAILEYCPNDAGSRFKDQAATADWLTKGRAVFLLLKDDELAGYGWCGAGTSEHVAGQTTFALRLGEIAQGQGLAAPFAQIMIHAAAALYGSRDFWLETWASNGAAVHTYHKIGFQDAANQVGDRPTTAGSPVPDTRLYMTLSNDQISASH